MAMLGWVQALGVETKKSIYNPTSRTYLLPHVISYIMTHLYDETHYRSLWLIYHVLSTLS